MTTFIHTLNTVELSPDTVIHVNPRLDSRKLSLDDPSLSVMTDLAAISAVKINPENSIEFAHELMKHASIRMLIVVDDRNALSGLVTARDILGEKPVNIMTRDKTSREEISVKQIMTPLRELDPLKFSEVKNASIRLVVLHLKSVGRQHAIVIDDLPDNRGQYLRGIFSVSHIARSLGIDISIEGHMQSFAEFERLLA